jgi:sialate O-acetylesterase
MTQPCSIGMLPDMHRPARLLQARLGSLIVLLAFAACARPTEAAPRLAAAFADHAVLQRDMPVPVWGWADAGEAITVEFAGQRQTATADATGRWQVRLKPLAASEEPRDLVVTGNGTLTIRDVLVGEVWLASGQSNMGSPLSSVDNAATVLPEASDPLLRFFTVVKATAPNHSPM